MGSTLEAQKKKAPKPKTQKITVQPGQPYYSSKELGKGYEQRLPSALASADLRKRSPFGKASPRAAVLDVAAGAMDLFRDEEGRRGSRFAEKVAEEINRNDGGMASKTRVF